jgi:hypothetical protein
VVGACQPEPFDGGPVTEALMVPVSVVGLDPGVEGGLGVVDGGEGGEVEELTTHRLVEPLHLAGGGRRVRAVSRWRMPWSWQIRSNATGPGPAPKRAVNTLALSVKIASGVP